MSSLLLFGICFILHCTSYARATLRVCYYGAWAAKDGLQPQHIDSSLCTHMILAFAELDANFTNIKTGPSFPVQEMMQFTHLKRNNPHLKTLISLGGWIMGSLPFMTLVANEVTMRAFATNAVKFLRAHDFDGIDIDWEFPNERGSEIEDKANFIKLLEILHTAFVNEPNRGNKERLLLTAAVAPTEERIIRSYNVQGLIKYLDLMGLITYDYHGEWENSVNVHNALYSTTDESVDGSLKYWLSQGVPKNKVLVGIPTYGRKFLLNDSTNGTIGASSNGGGDISYGEICKMIKTHQITPVTLQTEKVPYFHHKNQWITYEDVTSITEKAGYIRSQGVAGAMVWAINLDDYAGVCGSGTFPLLKALRKRLSTDAIVG
ncbi:chitotriosidase-1-like [Ruditapes philippinarum]|uniref:chitotriosidase-1-like n=1 Tax=Ruditapes philippinarum TaxID=129788 RepID=UPI00295BD411|nr:chitotriosidase-1-like [Ruditapes philippinarum]